MSEAPDEVETRLPLFEEVVHISKRDVVTERVLLHTAVQEHDERVEATLRSEEVTVERITINRPIDLPPPVREVGDTLIVPVLEEILVVEKRLVLKEEIKITRRARTQTHEQTVRLRVRR